MSTYLTNTNSATSAGWYEDTVAAVLLGHIGGGWATAEPPAETEADQPALNEFEQAQAAAVAEGRVLAEYQLRDGEHVIPAADIWAAGSAAIAAVRPNNATETDDTPPSVDETNPGESADNEGN